ncbi:MAG: hypothetical protein M3R69_09575, partial [Acidobacteriota bacterium]|nr:hypothetical protein [Acidobacteriota bacterium]
IQQMWGGTTHNWATFAYGEVYVAPSFGGSLLVNGPNNNYVSVLTRVDLADGSYFTFNYNAAFGQVNRINHYAADAHLLAYVSYNVDSSAGQTDCPRFTERRDWAEYWNGDGDGVPATNEEAVTTYSVAGDSSWTQQTAPDGTISKEFFATSGWQSGLTTSSEIWSGGVKKKWTTIAWTQDDETLAYQKNPRVTETNIYDAEGNRKRVTINYYPASSFSLPSDVYEYAVDGSTLLRRSHTDYNLNPIYTDRRIIGLVFGQYVYDGGGALQSKQLYHRDWDGYWLVDQGAGVGHDNANYGVGFVNGRANLVLVERYDVQYPDDQTRVLSVKTGYDTNGSVIFSGDGMWHRSDISYADAFSDGVNRNTFAFPTTVTDPDGFSSTAQYNYDFGAGTRTQDPKGAVQTMTYDWAGRIDRVTSQNTGAYTRYIYGPTYVQSLSSVNTVADEAYSGQFFDGGGRLTATSQNHPGSSGGYSAVVTAYDVMGRVSQQSNPAEITPSGIPTGDDAAGWAWTFQTYDWKGRALLTTNPDGMTREASYGGCGCAGGEVTTVRDERGRRRRLTKDVLGRLKQADELNWDQSIYASTSYNYNARDQLTSSNQSGQVRSFSYDGYGRLSAKYTPEQGATSYSYFLNDTVQTMTDARGATTTFAYNNRDLVTNIAYGVPAGVAATSNVVFGYDEAGNRTSMADGLGSVSYVYNTLSQITSETRTFSGVGSYRLSYGYNLAGELTSLTNPFGVVVGYNYDAVGRPISVTGSNYAGVTSYVNNIAYRAFGMKQMSYANGRTLSLSYDNRLRLTGWDIPGVLGWSYAYDTPLIHENTGRVAFANNLYDHTLDRSYDYDAVGRMWASHSG